MPPPVPGSPMEYDARDPGDDAPFSVVIPARYGSTRLPGKPLRDLAGRPVIAWVCDAAKTSGATWVCVATDDTRIAEVVQREGVEAVLTSTSHTTGTDRLSEVAQLRGLLDEEIAVNVQGDEPLLPPELIRLVARALAQHPDAGLATVATPIRTPQELFNPNVVKVVLDNAHFASYFSRAPIPWVRGDFNLASIPERLPSGPTFLRHVGLYAYRVGTLKRLTSVAPTTHETAESLEQLRALALGVRIHVSVVNEPPGHGIDTAEDLAQVAAQLNARTRDASRRSAPQQR